MLRRVIVILLILLTGCYAAIPVSTSGNMTCKVDGITVFSGDLDIKGTGLDAIDFDGNWSLCKAGVDVRCDVALTSTTAE